MQPTLVDDPGGNWLRFVFADRVVSVSLSADANLTDVARIWSDLATQDWGRPIAIDVTIAGSRHARASRKIRPARLASIAGEVNQPSVTDLARRGVDGGRALDWRPITSWSSTGRNTELGNAGSV